VAFRAHFAANRDVASPTRLRLSVVRGRIGWVYAGRRIDGGGGGDNQRSSPMGGGGQRSSPAGGGGTEQSRFFAVKLAKRGFRFDVDHLAAWRSAAGSHFGRCRRRHLVAITAVSSPPRPMLIFASFVAAHAHAHTHTHTHIVGRPGCGTDHLSCSPRLGRGQRNRRL
jgi:hypothetical protein